MSNLIFYLYRRTGFVKKFLDDAESTLKYKEDDGTGLVGSDAFAILAN